MSKNEEEMSMSEWLEQSIDKDDKKSNVKIRGTVLHRMLAELADKLDEEHEGGEW